MSKKKKEEVVINNEELKPTVLYTIKERKINFLGLLLLFALFIAVIYFLPTISEKYQEYKRGQTKNPVVIKPSDNQENESNDLEDMEQAEKKYEYSSSLKITKDSFTMADFNFSNNTLTFSITNNENSNIDLTAMNYYLSIFNSTNNLIKRIKVAEDVFNSKEKKNYAFNINANAISYFVLEEINPEDYPEITLTGNNGQASITCRNNETTFRYDFTNKELTNILETVTIANTATNYQSELAKYQVQVATYASYTGIQNNITETDTGFTYNLFINTSTANLRNLNGVNYYATKTAAKVISFEVEARGYTCS